MISWMRPLCEAPQMPARIVHLLAGLEIGGMERAVIRLASRGLSVGMDHRLLLFDRPFRSERSDFSPGSVATDYLTARRRFPVCAKPGDEIGETECRHRARA